MAGILSRATTQLFNGQSDIVIGLGGGTKYSDAWYSNTALSLKDFDDLISVGQVVEDTTDFTGEEASSDNLLDEQGNVITPTNQTSGTIAFTFSMANMSNAAVEFFLNGETESILQADFPDFISSSETTIDVVKFGINNATMTRPVGIINAAGDKIFFMPKASVQSSLSFEDDVMVISCTVTALSINVNEIGTAMILSANAKYDSGIAPLSLGVSPTSLQSPILADNDKATTKASKSSTL